MNEPKFSQGEWIKTGQFTLSIGGEESYLTTQQTGDYFASVEEREANAFLMVTANKMYQMLSDLASDYSCQCGHPRCSKENQKKEILDLLAEAIGEK